MQLKSYLHWIKYTGHSSMNQTRKSLFQLQLVEKLHLQDCCTPFIQGLSAANSTIVVIVNEGHVSLIIKQVLMRGLITKSATYSILWMWDVKFFHVGANFMLKLEIFHTVLEDFCHDQPMWGIG